MRRLYAPEPLLLKGPAGQIEAEVDRPDAEPTGVAILCHPHPLQGGTMHNKVVTTLARAFARAGVAAVRFNYRGVGGSEGNYADGAGELEDALSVIDWAMRGPFKDRGLYLAGFSFGGAIAFEAARRRSTKALITVAPAVRRTVRSATRPGCKWLIVQGSDDSIVPADAVTEWAEKFDPRPTIVTMEATDHFFHGRLGELAAAVSAFLGN